jgi:uncharacterized protein YecE (DUF72 family)
MAMLWIGTSGWHYKHWVGNFYPEGLPASAMLEHYVRSFDTVELNNTFYKLPARESLVAWRDSTPPHFHFAVKGSRFLTHMKKLKNAEEGLKRFLDSVDVLGPKLGPLLFQLPPNLEVDVERLEIFLSLLPSHITSVFEFRNPTWNAGNVFAALERHNSAYCIYELDGYTTPYVMTADLTYVRLHGPGGKYQGKYDEKTLSSWARRIQSWAEKMKAVYVYFDNDDSGYAPQNALRLKEILQHKASAGQGSR